MYRIGFTLGDPSHDGHGRTSDWHLKTSHSVDEIKNAYNKATKKLGWNYVEVICQDYEDSTINLNQVEDIENSLNINIKQNLTEWELKDLKHDGYCYLSSEAFISIFFTIVSSEIPNFEWEEVELDEEILYLLDGAGYGLFSC